MFVLSRKEPRLKFAFSIAMSDPQQACEMARVAEEAGWDGISVADHVIYPETLRTPYPYTPDGSPRWEESAPWPDPWIVIGAMAAVTNRLRFYTNVFVLPARNPFLAAKAVSTAAVLSENRVALGIGMGWMDQEFEALGQCFRNRGKRADEMIEVMRTLWQGGMVEYHGQFYDFEPLRMDPAPGAPIPIYVGGFSAPALRRAARNDGWISDLHSLAELQAYLDQLNGYRRELGSADKPFEVLSFNCTDAWDVDGFRRMEDMGVTWICTMPWFFYGGDMNSLQDKLDGIRRFAEEVIAKMR